MDIFVPKIVKLKLQDLYLKIELFPVIESQFGKSRTVPISARPLIKNKGQPGPAEVMFLFCHRFISQSCPFCLKRRNWPGCRAAPACLIHLF